ncbi:hypothetical protein Sjap_009315 [Stephania japonica]|uniref:Reticulon-like protein n=1 Tax=Stephania japonica TaxID=461633 RepID=A0AAP0JRU5_9MAGN
MAIDEDFVEEERPICTVLGGRSFIGRSLVAALLKSGKWIVRIADSAPSIDLDLTERDLAVSEAVSSGFASYFQVDVRLKSQIVGAIEGSSVVFHIDATDSSLNDFYHQHPIIVQGTKNVINACRACKVKRLVYNSSADVVFDGTHDIYKGDESLPYPWKFKDMLNDLKSQAEALVLFANSFDGLLTCALRPSNPFGPGDANLVPSLLNLAKSSFSKFIIGSGEKISDFTYVDNIAYAHVCAEEALCSRTASVAGKAFNITDIQPMKFREFASPILEGLGYQSPTIKFPASLVLFFLVLVNWLFEKLGCGRSTDSIVSPTVFHLVSRTRTFSCLRAQNYIGYRPIASFEKSVAATIELFSHIGEASLYSRCQGMNEPSKVEKLLGSGTIADILLWRDEKRTFLCFLATSILFYWFFLSGRTFISSVANLLLLVSVLLFSNGLMPPSFRLCFKNEKMSSDHFQVSQTTLKNGFMFLFSIWNQCVQTLRSFAQDGDFGIFFKALVFVYLFKVLFSFSVSAVIAAGLVFAYTAFLVYEQYEHEVDRTAFSILVGLKRLTVLVMRKLPESATSFLNIHLASSLHGESTMVKDQDNVAAM